MADGFLNRLPENEEEKKLLGRFYTGFRLDNLATWDSFREDLVYVGFKNIQMRDKTSEAISSIMRMHNYSKWERPLAIVLTKLHLILPVIKENTDTGIAEYDAIKRGLGGHILFYAEK